MLGALYENLRAAEQALATARAAVYARMDAVANGDVMAIAEYNSVKADADDRFWAEIKSDLDSAYDRQQA